MAFKPVAANTQRRPFVTIAVRGNGEKRGIALSRTAHRAIGEPRAIAFEWDEDESLLRIGAASPDAPNASRLPAKESHGVAATTLLNQIGVAVDETTRITVTPDGPLAVIADLSEYRSTP